MTDTCDNWTDWFDRNAAVMLLLARQRVANQADAEDIVQNAFVRFWPRRKWVNDARAYLYRCVKRCATDFLRESKRRRSRENAVATSTIRRREPLFNRNLQASERQAQIEAALWRLPTEQREVLVLKVWTELTFDQIAKVLKASQNTVTSRYRYALNALRRELIKESVP